jgi:hypothetical protein
VVVVDDGVDVGCMCCYCLIVWVVAVVVAVVIVVGVMFVFDAWLLLWLWMMYLACLAANGICSFVCLGVHPYVRLILYAYDVLM